MDFRASLFQHYASSRKLQAEAKTGNGIEPSIASGLFPVAVLPLVESGFIDCKSTVLAGTCVHLPTTREAGLRVIRDISSSENFYRVCGGKDVFDYLVTELMDNIYQHSEFSKAFVMAQRFDEARIVELCFLDNGLTIQGVLKRHGKNLDAVGALQLALQGFSTKSPERGYGLRTSMRLASEGLKGEFLVVSGSAAFSSRPLESAEYALDLHLALPGTLIAIRMPFTSKVDNFYDYLS